jgi:hypothetical protein
MKPIVRHAVLIATVVASISIDAQQSAVDATAIAAARAGKQAGGAPAAHPEEAAILAVIDRFMQAVSAKDPVLLAEVRLPGSLNLSEQPQSSGRGTRISRRPFDPDDIKKSAAPFRERYWDPVVLVRGRLAVVWTPYEFWTGGATSHCGVDVFELVKEDGRWRIGNMMWSVEPDACQELRPADPARIRPRD